ncbi:hypothetical protein ACFWY9_26435 [Amycolatopsis sp. NPDC059027]|uniref:hypothetical protein n=1 Tax=unclassified Amycolatopsis TaxID=2618356 RepID=UPI00366EAB65
MVTAAGLLVTACSGNDSGMSGMDHGTSGAPVSGQDMPGMAMPAGDGLAAESAGFRFAPETTSLPAGQPSAFRFRITGAGGAAVTAFQPEQTKLMHFYLIRTDLSGFQHLHPVMAADGTWTADLAAAQPGTYRAYTQFTTKDSAGKDVPLVLSRQVTVPGDAPGTPLPAASAMTTVDGYTLTLGGDKLMAGMSHELTVTVSKDGKPVTDLQPYLDTYAHLTGFHAGDQAFAHLHPHGKAEGDHGGPALKFEATLPKAGDWRLFVQFQTGGVLHTAAVTLAVG